MLLLVHGSCYQLSKILFIFLEREKKVTQNNISRSIFAIPNLYTENDITDFWSINKFTCACCQSRYVDETTRHYDVRVNEHLHKKAQPSSIFKH